VVVDNNNVDGACGEEDVVANGRWEDELLCCHTSSCTPVQIIGEVEVDGEGFGGRERERLGSVDRQKAVRAKRYRAKSHGPCSALDRATAKRSASNREHTLKTHPVK
jgi:hypothetical protein